MTDNERIELLRSYCQFSSYPPELTDAICDYLAGQGTIEQVRQFAQSDLRNIFTISPPLLIAWGFGAHPSINMWEPLDALDCRLLDVCEATDQVWTCLQEVSHSAAIQESIEYLLTQGMTPLALMQGLSGIMHLTHNQQGHMTPFGQALLTLVPTQMENFVNRLRGLARQSYPMQVNPPQMLRLLLSANPPEIEQAWNVVQELEAQEEQANMSTLGQCACLLLKADSERFTPWALTIARPDSRASAHSRLLVLQALLERDPAQHSDLAVEALRSTFGSHNWKVYQLRGALLATLVNLDPVRFLPLLTEAALALDTWETWHAMQLLTQAPFEQARPHLQQCVEGGGIAVASQALKRLLQQQWEGCLDYAVSLLAHPYKRIRREATAWLAQQGEAPIAGIEPFLTHLDAEVRLSAIDALAAIGGERAHTILRERLDLERLAKIRQAIFGVVGLPERQRASGPLTRETLLANAAATLHYVSKPAPRWFVAGEVPAPLWANNEPVPASVLLYLLYRQSFVAAPATLDGEVSQALALFNRSTTGSLANYLFSGWVARGNNPKEAWCIPLICALGDDALLPALSLRVEDWHRDNRRKLAIHIIQALPLFESQAATNELRGLAKLLRRGIAKTAAKETLAAVAP